MLRVLLWKICFEWVQLRRILWPGVDQKVYYFAFGANLSPKVLEKRKIQVFDTADFVLSDAELGFTQRGFYKNHGYASADEKIGEQVYGKVYLILKSDAARMDYFEGVPFLNVHEKESAVADEIAYYYYRAVKIFPGLRPTQEYLDYIVHAYREMPIVPQSYTDELAKTEVLVDMIPQDSTGVFVKDLDNWPNVMHSTLVFYEGATLRLNEFLWNRSLFQWLIKV